MSDEPIMEAAPANKVPETYEDHAHRRWRPSPGLVDEETGRVKADALGQVLTVGSWQSIARSLRGIDASLKRIADSMEKEGTDARDDQGARAS